MYDQRVACGIKSVKTVIKTFSCSKHRKFSSSDRVDSDRLSAHLQGRQSRFLTEFLNRDMCHLRGQRALQTTIASRELTTLGKQHTELMTAEHCAFSHKLKSRYQNLTPKPNPLDASEVAVILGMQNPPSHNYNAERLFRSVQESQDDILSHLQQHMEKLETTKQHLLPPDVIAMQCLHEKLDIVSCPLTPFEEKMLLHIEPSSQHNAKPPHDPSINSGKPSAEQLEKTFRTLEAMLPNFFSAPHDYRIYNQGIVFENNIREVTTYGLASYVQQLSLLRILGHIKFAYINMDVLKITKHPEEGCIKVRWCIKGLPGYKAIFTFWKYNFLNLKKGLDERNVWYDGFSTFYLGSDGLIYKHVCDKMMPDDSKEKIKTSHLAAKLALVFGLLPRITADDLADSLSCSAAFDSPKKVFDQPVKIAMKQ